MGYVFEELIRIGAEQSNEEAGEHFTPREVIKLMVNLLLSPEQDLRRSHVVKTIYDPACGTGGMLSVAERYIERTHSGAINLGVGEAAPVRSPTDVGTGKAKDDKAPLSEIIEVLNKRFGTLFTEEDRLFFQQIKEKACNSEQVVRTALANPLDKFELGIRKLIEDLMIERMAENDKIVTRYMADRDFQSSAFPILAREIFEAVRAAVGQGTAGSGESESKTDSKTA
jgi:hypothetical protein